MDHAKFSTIAHRDHDHCNPLDPVVLDQAIERLKLGPGLRVLDIGCGKAAFLVRVAERTGATCTGVDTNVAFLAEAKASAERRGVAALVTPIECEASRLDPESAPYDAGVCIGSTHAFGSYRATLQELARRVHPGGSLLIGEGYWKRAPDPDYLARLGATEEEMTSHQGNLAAAVEVGLQTLAAWVSSDRDWDRYEDLYARTVEIYVAAHPDDPDTPEMRERIRRWRETYLRWGRDTLGFGLYLFRRR